MPPSHPPAAPQHPEDPLMTHTWPSPSASSWSPGLSLSLLIPTACDSSPWSRLAPDVVALGNSFHVEGEQRLLMQSGGPGLSRSLLLIFLLITSSGHLRLVAGSSSVQYRTAPTGPSPAPQLLPRRGRRGRDSRVVRLYHWLTLFTAAHCVFSNSGLQVSGPCGSIQRAG